MSFISVLNIAKTVISLIPLVVQAIQVVEAAIPGKGKGEQKLSMVRSIIEEVYDEADDLIEPFEAIWTRLSRLVSRFVVIFNGDGTFKK